MSEEVNVGNITKTVKRPVPRKAAVEQESAAILPEASSEDGIAELNKKMDKLLEFAQAMDWKMWVYLKANNYID
jgi:heterodisulfide reductase subunit B